MPLENTLLESRVKLSDFPTGPPRTAAVCQDQLGILVQSLKECVAEVAERARRSVSFVLLQEAVCSTAQGLQLQQRRDAVFSQAVSD